MFAQVDDNDKSDDTSPLPPLLIQTGSLEILFHEILVFACSTLAKSTGAVNLEVYEDMVHDHMIVASDEFVGKLAVERIGRFVKEATGVPQLDGGHYCPDTPYVRNYTIIEPQPRLNETPDKNDESLESLVIERVFKDPLAVVEEAKITLAELVKNGKIKI
ncbi:hypothetical protein HK096_008567 [Nowakowskiella sp. JEL0078]|nr:hypothetical protein HK096_008567 [Nowakowskiella sp. JEL0078]